MSEKHHGWTNYETWWAWAEWFRDYNGESMSTSECRQYVDVSIARRALGNYAFGIANAICDNVNWDEVARVTDMNKQIKEIVNKLAEKMILDVASGETAESAARFQINQLKSMGIPAEVATGLVELALRAAGDDE